MNARTARTALALAVAAFACNGAALAQSGEEVLKTKGCMGCHDKEKKKVGPAFKDVAAKKPKAEDLVAKVSGAKGHPKVSATEAEVKAAVDAVLATK